MGDSIKLFKNTRDILNIKEKGVIVQRYITNPLLLGKKKFDLRVYVVLTGINEGKMEAYLADEGLARFCTEDYEKPNA